MAAFEREVFDVGRACFGHSQAVESEQHRECGVGVVVAFGGEEECAERGAVHACGIVWMHGRSAHVLRWVRGDAPVDVGEAEEPANGGESSVDGGRGEISVLE